MTETNTNLPTTSELEHKDVAEQAIISVPQYRRDLFPKNIVLSAKDLSEFCELLTEANERAKQFQIENTNVENFKSAEDLKERIDELMPIQHSYTALSGDHIEGIGIPKTDERLFPEELTTFFASNAVYAKNAVNQSPANTVDAFLDFQKPTLKIDLLTLPSNPTENKSVINVSGRSEDWVIS
ncbi:MAG: hypothetical protein AAFN76_01900, partial [Pseudomonadota bacterium]